MADIHVVAHGDSLTPLGLHLKQWNGSSYAAVSLTGKTVKVFVVDEAGTVRIAETETGVTVVEAATGKVSYTWPDGASALPEGKYFLYARVYSGSDRDSFPVQAEALEIRVVKHIRDT